MSFSAAGPGALFERNVGDGLRAAPRHATPGGAPWPGPRLFVARNPSGLNMPGTLARLTAAHRAAGVAAPTDHEGKEFRIRQGAS